MLKCKRYVTICHCKSCQYPKDNRGRCHFHMNIILQNPVTLLHNKKKEVEEARVKKELLKSMQLSRCYNNLMEERFTLIIKLTPIEL